VKLAHFNFNQIDLIKINYCQQCMYIQREIQEGTWGAILTRVTAMVQHVVESCPALREHVEVRMNKTMTVFLD
jgi:hypothetical protein